MEYLILAVLIAINAFFAAGELSIVTARKVRIRQLAEEGNRGARSVLRLSDNPGRFLATIQIGVTLTAFFASAFGAENLVGQFEQWISVFGLGKDTTRLIAFIVETIVVAFFTLVFGELVPKTLAVEAAENVAMIAARPIEFVARVATPFVAFLTGFTNLIVRLLGGKRKVNSPTVTQEEVVSLVETGQEEGVFELQQEEMIRSVFDFSEKRVREVMRPRPDMYMVDANQSVAEAAPVIADSDYSRYPVFDENRETIIGIVFAKDVLRSFVSSQTTRTVRDIIRPPIFVPESKHVSELFSELQKSRSHMAIVIDEYGSVAGLVTLEDMLEEIVGEIQDEFDHEESFLTKLGPNEYLVNGQVSLFDLNEELDLELGEDNEGERLDVDTLGGLVMAELKHIPVVGESVRIDLTDEQTEKDRDDEYERDRPPEPLAVELRVEEMDGLRISKVNLKVEYPPQADTEVVSPAPPLNLL